MPLITAKEAKEYLDEMETTGIKPIFYKMDEYLEENFTKLVKQECKKLKNDIQIWLLSINICTINTDRIKTLINEHLIQKLQPLGYQNINVEITPQYFIGNETNKYNVILSCNW